MRIRGFNPGRRWRKLVRIAAVLVIAPLPVQVLACGGTTLVAQIESGGSLSVFFGFGQMDVTGTAGTETTANSWRVGWYGGAGITHFTGRIVDSEGGSITLEDVTSGTTTQPNPAELDFAATFDLNTAQGVDYIDFISTSRSIELHLEADAFFIISYAIPGNTEQHPNTDPFGLSFDATPTAIPDLLGNMFCDGFE
jgi:hypothetical protein